MDILKQFVENEVVRESVKEYFRQTLEQEVLNKAFQGEDIKGYVEAKKIIDKAFSNLEGQYGKKESRNTQDSR